MKLRPLPKLKESRLGQVWFVFFQVTKLAWEVSPKLLIFTLLASTVSGFLIYPILRLEKIFIDSLIENIGADFWGPAGQFIIFILFLRFGVGIAQDILDRFSHFLRRMISRIFSAYLTTLMAKKNAELDLTTLENPEFKDKFSKIQREGSRRAWGMMWPVAAVPMTLTSLASTLVIIFSFRPVISVIVFLLSIPAFWVDAKYIKKEYQFETKMSLSYRIWGWLDHYLLRPKNILEIKLLKLSQLFSERMKKIQNKIFSKRLAIEKKKTVLQIIASLPQNIFHFVISVYLVFFVFAGKLTVGSVEMIIRAIYSFRENVAALVANFLELYENYLYVTDFVWLLSLKPSLAVSRQGKKLAQKLASGIEFKNVWFRYTEESPWVLENVSLKIGPREEVAIVGENGAGKSTLVKLLCRFYDPQKGQIFLNGVSLKKYSIESLWDNLSVLFQDFEFYPFSAKESIAYGDIKKIGKSKLIKKAAQKAKIAEFIESLPLKYQNSLDPSFKKGTRPSVGQWQRFGLARIFFKNAQITVLDEPTSNVDPQAEEEIFKEIISQTEGKILILISHRFSTVRQADKIFVLDKGKIIEQGTHQQLMKAQGRYARLFELQAKGYR